LGRFRAIFDANLYLNLLLSRNPERSLITRLLRSAAQQEFALLLPADLVAELSDASARRPHLAARVNRTALETLFQLLLEFATPLPLLEHEPPRIVRDSNDDYLIALAVLSAADFIVTRDRDLLDLHEVTGVRIVDAVTFLELLQAGAELDETR
jgi:putative PIN family toxin of toxin-antitoxin system